MQIDGVTIVHKDGGTFIQDPANGALYPAISGSQYDDWGTVDTSWDIPSDVGSYNAQDYSGYVAPTGTPLGYPAGLPPVQADSPYTPAGPIYPEDPMATGQPGGWTSGDPSGTGIGIGDPAGGGAGGSSWWQRLLDPGDASPGGGGGYGGGGYGGLGVPGMLGAAGGLAGLIGALTAGGVGQRTMPQLSVPARAAGNQAYAAAQGLAPFAAGTTPLQATQASLLQGLASGQIPPGLAQLVEQAYGPQFQSVYGQAAEEGRKAGFYDAPATSPAGGAVLGPALAQLQGQRANSLLGLMMQMPGEFQAPINAQLQAAGNQVTGFNNLLGSYPYGKQESQPLGNQVFQGLAGTLGGLGQGMAQNQYQQGQQQWQNQMLQSQQQQNQIMQRAMLNNWANGGQGSQPGPSQPGPITFSGYTEPV